MLAQDRYLTADEVAERLQLCPETIRRWLREGRLKGTKFGNRFRVLESDLQAFIDSVDE